MKLWSLLFLSIFIAAACSSSKSNNRENRPDGADLKADTTRSMEEKYPNLVTLNPPKNKKAVPSTVYIDSMRLIEYKKQKALFITGNFANGCSSLKSVNHQIEGDTLTITLKAWQPAEVMCTQALVPFSFIYSEFSENGLPQYKIIKTTNTTLNLD